MTLREKGSASEGISEIAKKIPVVAMKRLEMGLLESLWGRKKVMQDAPPSYRLAIENLSGEGLISAKFLREIQYQGILWTQFEVEITEKGKNVVEDNLKKRKEASMQGNPKQ